MKKLAKKLKKVLKKNETLIDLIIFGSKSKNNIRSRDIDIAAITKKETNRPKLKQELQKTISKEIDLQLFPIEKYDSFLWITLIREGFSIKHNKYLSDVYKIKPVVLYKYSLKELTISKKVMFERAIKKFKNIKKLSNRVVLVPFNISGEFDDFLRSWKLDIDTEEYALMPLVRK